MKITLVKDKSTLTEIKYYESIIKVNGNCFKHGLLCLTCPFINLKEFSCDPDKITNESYNRLFKLKLKFI